MTARLIDMLLRLGKRERLLLGLLVLVAVPVGIIFSVLLPLENQRFTALQDRNEAAALNIWVQQRVAEKPTTPETVQAAPQAPIGTSGIEQDLIAVGLRDAVRALSGDSDGVVALRFDNVGFTRLADWLSAASPNWGYDITQFRIEAGTTPGNVAASLSLTPQNR